VSYALFSFLLLLSIYYLLDQRPVDGVDAGIKSIAVSECIDYL